MRSNTRALSFLGVVFGAVLIIIALVLISGGLAAAGISLAAAAAGIVMGAVLFVIGLIVAWRL